MEWGMIVLGAVLLAFGSSSLLRGLAEVGRRSGAPPFWIGLVLIAPALAAPFALTGLALGREGQGEFAAGALIGAALAYWLGLAGLAALIRPARVDRRAALLDGIAVLALAAAVAAVALLQPEPQATGAALCASALAYLGLQAWRRPRGPAAPAAPGRADPLLLAICFAALGGAAAWFGASLIGASAGPLTAATGWPAGMAGVVLGGLALSTPPLLGVARRAFSSTVFPPTQAIAAPLLGAPVGLGAAFLTGLGSIAPLAPEAQALLAAALAAAGFYAFGAGLSRRDGLILVMGFAGFVTWIVSRLGA